MLEHNRWAFIRRILLILLPPGGDFGCWQRYLLSIGWEKSDHIFVSVMHSEENSFFSPLYSILTCTQRNRSITIHLVLLYIQKQVLT